MREPRPRRTVAAHLSAAIRLATSAFLITFLFCLGQIVHAADGPVVGFISNLANEAQVVRSGAATPATMNALLYMQDELRTGSKGRLQVTFRDKTTLTLGENARVVIDRFVFNPDQSTGQLLLNSSVAAFRLATGSINGMRNKDITVKTPVAALAVRGTDFWWGPIDGFFGVLLVDNSRLAVSNEAGGVLLNEAGEGTDIDPLKGGGAPGRPYKWPPDKIQRALQQTAIGPAFGPAPLLAPLVPLIPIIPELTEPEQKPRPASP
jgi:hypothetical protein